MIKAIVGAAWGDEGKGKITDMLAKQADIVIRFQGGANAGHTIINDYGRFALHQLPSGIFNTDTLNIIGPGVALDISKLVKEIQAITDSGINDIKLMISDRTQIVMPYHILFDVYEEERLSNNAYGSTKSGISPFYSDKFAKKGIQVNELFDEDLLYKRLKDIIIPKNILLEHLYHKPLINLDELFSTLISYRKMISKYIGNTHIILQDAIKKNKNILLEGQLGALKDPDHGIYPMVTSSSTLAGYGSVGAGVPPHLIKEIITVVKAYSSSVGAGAFVSEIFGEEASLLRNHGGDSGEYGATTGRPRRMGWFDCVATRYGCEIQGTTAIALTVIDALSYLKEIPVCVAYEIDGNRIDYFPNTNILNKAKPVIEILPGWNCDIRGITDFSKLPNAAKEYIEFIEKSMNIPISLISTGPKRDEVIIR